LPIHGEPLRSLLNNGTSMRGSKTANKEAYMKRYVSMLAAAGAALSLAAFVPAADAAHGGGGGGHFSGGHGGGHFGGGHFGGGHFGGGHFGGHRLARNFGGHHGHGGHWRGGRGFYGWGPAIYFGDPYYDDYYDDYDYGYDCYWRHGRRYCDY
jgi:hypothetical protein